MQIIPINNVKTNLNFSKKSGNFLIKISQKRVKNIVDVLENSKTARTIKTKNSHKERNVIAEMIKDLFG